MLQATGWTAEREATLQRLWPNMTALEISMVLGDEFSDRSVQVKATRMGLSKKFDKWPTEREIQLIMLWADGMSAKRIAAEMGGFEHCADGGRSAVIGKVHRLNLPMRKTIVTTPRTYPNGHRAKAPPRPRTPYVRKSPDIAPSAALPPLMVQLFDLERTQCRWPVGDPGEPLFGFCGHPQHDGSSYCPAHHCEGYQRPGQPRKGFVVTWRGKL